MNDALIVLVPYLTASIVIIFVASSFHLFGSRRNRLWTDKRPLIALAIGVSGLLACIIFYFYKQGLDFGAALGIAGFTQTGFLAFCRYVYVKFFSTKNIVYLGKSSSGFSQALHRGLASELAKSGYALVSIVPEKKDHENAEWQSRALAAESVRRCDALVIVPADDDPLLLMEVRSLMRRGIVVVVIDCKLPNDEFYEHRLTPPRFVTSDFRQGGKLVAELIGSHAPPGSTVLFLIGPEFSEPALIRARSAIMGVLYADYPVAIEAVAIESWSPEQAWSKLSERITQLGVQESVGIISPMVVYCANDRILMHVETELQRSMIDPHMKVLLVGYDGVRNDENQYICVQSIRALGTVDVQPFEQGEMAARLICEAAEGVSQPHRRIRKIAPQKVVSRRTATP